MPPPGARQAPPPPARGTAPAGTRRVPDDRAAPRPPGGAARWRPWPSARRRPRTPTWSSRRGSGRSSAPLPARTRTTGRRSAGTWSSSARPTRARRSRRTSPPDGAAPAGRGTGTSQGVALPAAPVGRGAVPRQAEPLGQVVDGGLDAVARGGDGAPTRLETPAVSLDATLPPGGAADLAVPAGFRGFAYLLGGG